MKRRELLFVLAALPAIKIERAADLVASLGGLSFAPTFFTPEEWATVRILVDDIIPRDARSGSATDAKVPEFMDVFLADPEIPPQVGVQIRSGLAWLARESAARFGRGYDALSEAERRRILDDIAWPARAAGRADLGEGVAFFNRFRDFTASGFWSSPMGYRDLEVQGGVFVAEWKGCPEAAHRHLGV